MLCLLSGPKDPIWSLTQHISQPGSNSFGLAQLVGRLVRGYKNTFEPVFLRIMNREFCTIKAARWDPVWSINLGSSNSFGLPQLVGRLVGGYKRQSKDGSSFNHSYLPPLFHLMLCSTVFNIVSSNKWHFPWGWGVKRICGLVLWHLISAQIFPSLLIGDYRIRWNF